MKYTYSLIILFLFSNQVFSQGWTNQNSNVTNTLFGVHFLNANTGMAVGEQGRIIKTTNGGAFWQSVNFSDTYFLKAVYMVDEFVAFAVGSVGTVIKTTNGGTTWTSIISSGSGQFNCLSFLNSSVGWVGGFTGNVLRTTNGGLNWNNQPEVDFTINGMEFIDLNFGMAVGDGGKIYKTINGGFNWSTRNSGTNGNLFAIDIWNADTAVIVGAGGTVLLSVFGGDVWEPSPTGLSAGDQLNSVTFCGNSANICAVGKNGRVIRTTNFGQSWIVQATSTSDELFGVDFVNGFTGYSVGVLGRAIKTVNGGGVNIKQISSEIPSNFSLEQNYPNPFNPKTVINFSLPNNSFVSLDIYDISGKLVKKLISQNMSLGRYSVDFNSESLNSGVYFYRLTTETYSETRKMTLIK
ncbi:MAG TPA: YCF48-related protein [Ignavibacteria bacterium]|nr:YCF48-related protein [Ignavibacteria bacterium]